MPKYPAPTTFKTARLYEDSIGITMQIEFTRHDKTVAGVGFSITRGAPIHGTAQLFRNVADRMDAEADRG